MQRRLAALAACATLATASAADASTPSSGKVSKATPTFSWTGETNGYGFSAVSIATSGFLFCEAPLCDTFTLEVADSDQLTIALTGPSSFMGVEVEQPDGTIHYNYGEETSPRTVVFLAKAAAGTYIVRAVSNNPPGFDGGYAAEARLGPPPPEEGEAPVPGPAPAPTPAPAPAPAPAAPAPTITIGAKSASAKRLAKTRKLVLPLSASAAVTDVDVRLLRGSKTVARGRLARLEGKRRFTLRVPRKLRAGSYKLAVTAKSASGANVGASVPFRVTR